MKMNVPVHKKARIEIIPLIDVIFFCLATFVLVTLTMNRNRSVNVNLPAAESGQRPERIDQATLIAVTEQGEIFWNLERLSFDQLVERLPQYRRTETDPRIMINADERTPFESMTILLDEVRKAGFPNVEIVTRQPRRAPGGG